MDVLDSQAFLERLVGQPRPGSQNYLACYNHQVRACTTDPALMLLPLDDHLVHRGDGLFETLKWEDGRLYQLEPHVGRLSRGAAAIHLNPPCPWEEIASLTVETARLANRPHGYVRILLGRGVGGFGIDMAECPVASLFIITYAYTPKPESFYDKGVTAAKVSTPAKQGWFARIKSTDYLPNALMKREAKALGADFAICFDEHGYLAEGATENICMVDRHGKLVIPEFDRALAGTTVVRAVELISNEVPVLRRPVHEDELLEARELLVVGTTWDAIGIVRYNDKPVHDVRPGPITRRMRELLRQDLRQEGVLVYEG
ncbi:aminotransferase class IV [Megalodesulfovibrio gigas]|uniref:Putative aminotransferase class IV n=1 Tax=Megalodesulfovibrio gigas (strain ATCC 19364 / DSM 1382 / NCIMB 9332 / VKM B-1759) TaxID=1121448 RepID=T2G7Q9_MEGG1|nr:aminotransferase class IV [Megalodesulfovibrio gigas]AGW12328.1 putative aminotransferase class IV [Megalodesulfovibrio gigas DSM 1382 = ATCC 19364]